ncbi:hypothetical protein EYF80_027905 [Liparis tanakae]|uniref:Uncharacterized protein n=1 Tax=Liparis tanakae TaxID=230148 RepID=A0A4Z2H7U9_9TELE|nr:hypothetical protein EYF80_027905 [Liparis tanakae]
MKLDPLANSPSPFCKRAGVAATASPGSGTLRRFSGEGRGDATTQGGESISVEGEEVVTFE